MNWYFAPDVSPTASTPVGRMCVVEWMPPDPSVLLLMRQTRVPVTCTSSPAPPFAHGTKRVKSSGDVKLRTSACEVAGAPSASTSVVTAAVSSLCMVYSFRRSTGVWVSPWSNSASVRGQGSRLRPRLAGQIPWRVLGSGRYEADAVALVLEAAERAPAAV